MSDNREAFEAWFSDDGKWPASIERTKDGSYKYAVANNQWKVWQAALAHSAAEKDAEIERLQYEKAASSALAEQQTIEIARLQRVTLLMADKLEAHGEKFNAAEFDAALAAEKEPK